MSTVVFLQPSEELQGFGEKAVEKFNGICSANIKLEFAKNTSQVGDLLGARRVSIIFVDKAMEKAGLNTFLGVYTRTKNKPAIIALSEVAKQLEEVPSSSLITCPTEFSETFVFSAIRNLLTPPSQKLDVRYIKSIITSVVSVINENTQIELIPGNIVEAKAEEKPEELSGVLGFYGDGFLGSLTISANTELLKEFTQKMLYCEASDVNEELMIDVMNELCNQVLGVIRSELSEFGYRLTTSFQAMVHSDAKFLHTSSSNGRYYSVPFSYEDNKFDITLCYNTYQTSLDEVAALVSAENVKHENVLDVRLVNTVIDCTREIVHANIGFDVESHGRCKLLGEIYEGNSLNVFHLGGFQGSVFIGLEMPLETTYLFFKKMMGMDREDVSPDGINDLFAEMINQVGGEFIGKVHEFGYTYQRIFHGTFSGKSAFRFLLKNPGLYFRQEFRIGPYPFFLVFGVNSQAASSFFNVWNYYLQEESFGNQITLEHPRPEEMSSFLTTEEDTSESEEGEGGDALFF